MEERIHPITNPEVMPFKPLPVSVMDAVLAPMRFYFDPVYKGIENLDPKRPALYISNHSVIGLMDGPLLVHEMYRKLGIYPRPLVDNMHQDVPIWRDYVSLVAGGVRGTRHNCEQLMQQGDSILVFPGGLREACKRKNEKNVLVWQKRKGFARMAMKFGYPIVPVAVLGGDDMYDIVTDADEMMKTVLGKFLESSGFGQKYFKNGEHIPPIVKGVGFSVIPKPAKLYHYYGKPIETTEYKERFEDEELQSLIRKKTEDAMYAMMSELRDWSEKEKNNQPLWRRILSKI